MLIRPISIKTKNVINLFIEIKKYAPEFNSENLDKEIVWNKLFSEKDYNYGIMKNLIFDLNKLVEIFIVDLKSYKDEYKRNEYLVSALLDRKLHKLYIKKNDAIDTALNLNYINLNNLEHTQYFNFAAAMVKTKLSFHENYDKNFKSDDLYNRHDLYKLSNFLLFVFDAYRIAFVNSVVNNSNLENNPVSKTIELILPGVDALIEDVNVSLGSISIYIKIYLLMYLALKEKNEVKYIEFKKIVFDNIHILPKQNIQDLHLGLLTVFSRIKHEDLDLNEVIEIYDSLIKNNLITLLNTNIIPIHIFNNYISTCFYLSECTKLETFASRYVNMLEPKYVKNSGIYVKFMISFLKKNFEDALMQISLLDISYFTQKIALKYQKVMCIYELGDYEMFMNEFDNLKHFVKNNSFISDNERAKANTFLSIIKNLFSLKQNFDQYELKTLKDQIRITFENTVIMNDWFKEKLIDIEKANIKKLKYES